MSSPVLTSMPLALWHILVGDCPESWEPSNTVTSAQCLGPPAGCCFLSVTAQTSIVCLEQG